VGVLVGSGVGVLEGSGVGVAVGVITAVGDITVVAVFEGVAMTIRVGTDDGVIVTACLVFIMPIRGFSVGVG
jgi:hypothetical protein